MVGGPSRWSGSGQGTLLLVLKWSGDPPGSPIVVGSPSRRYEVVWRPSRRSGSGWEPLTEIQKWSGDPPGGPVVVGSPSRRSRSGRETLPEV